MPRAAVDVAVGERAGESAVRLPALLRRGASRRSPSARAGGGTRPIRRSAATRPARSAPASADSSTPSASAARSSSGEVAAVARGREDQGAPLGLVEPPDPPQERPRDRCRERASGAPSGASASSSASPASSSSAERVAGGRVRAAAAPASGGMPAQQRGASSLGSARRAVSVGRSAPSSSEGSPSRTAIEHGDRVGDQPADGEQQRLRAGVVEPVGVVDQHGDRALLGVGGQQAERRRSDREAILGRGRARARARPRARPPAAPGSGRAPRSAGRSSSSSDANGICASDSIPRARSTRISVGSLRGVIEQRRLADAGLADERQRRARRPDRAPSSTRSISRRSRSRPSSMARF